jgi:hypothetical protein
MNKIRDMQSFKLKLERSINDRAAVDHRQIVITLILGTGHKLDKYMSDMESLTEYSFAENGELWLVSKTGTTEDQVKKRLEKLAQYEQFRLPAECLMLNAFVWTESLLVMARKKIERSLQTAG